MTPALRRLGIALGALVEAALVLWLIGGFPPAGLPLGLLTLVLGYLIYRDILRRGANAPSDRGR
ncbi:MAG: hypothetical protein ACYDAN_14055 [Candidatus Limnocylindrales bacterium]